MPEQSDVPMPDRTGIGGWAGKSEAASSRSRQPGVIARAAIPQRLDQLEDALNETAKRAVGALAEAAMARQETSAQSQRIDRAMEDGQNAAAALRYEINAANARAYTHASKMATSLDESYDERCDALSKRLDALEEWRKTTSPVGGYSVESMLEFIARVEKLEQAVSQMPAPKLSVSRPVTVDSKDFAERLSLIRDLDKLMDSTQTGSWQYRALLAARKRIQRG